ncbi:peptidoglycan DD-metalloendopeptidase family protein [Flavobacteriales bacterium]|nr:peptidoglycan DD-metalloendopeptidase family protein [Flavobacteriales bacterium]
MEFRLNIFISSCIFFGLVLLFSTCNSNNTNIQNSGKKLIKPVKDVVRFKKIQGFSLENFKVDSSSVKNGFSFSEILQSLNVPYKKIYSLGNDFKEIYDLRKIYQGDKYYTIFNSDSNKFSNLIYQHSLTEKVVMSFLDSLNIIIIKSPIEIRIQKASGTITSSLWQSFIDNKLSPALVSKVASLYAWTIDFFDIQSGDNYKIIFESKYVENKFIGVGNIKAVLFNHKGRDFYAFRYLSKSKKVESYFTDSGESMQRALLSAPLEYVRISSKFSNRRLHPIKKVYRPHHGVDYAAPSGTDVVSTGDGKVIFAARSGGAGNMIKIKHSFGNVVTKYLHLLRFEKGIKVGKYVEQGQKIGEVGSTGLSTGPHLDYRVYINGKAKNPLKLNIPSKDPIAENLKSKYSLDIADIKATLDSIKTE